MDGIIAKALTERINGVATIDEIERIDRLIANAKIRRNAILREIDGRRAVLGEALRRNMQELEADDVKVIEATSRERKARGVTSERKIRANRANARASTGPKTAQGRARTARNALRHGLSLPVYSDPTLSEEVEALAREIAGPDATAEIQGLARQIAEAQIDLRRVRCARHQFLCR